MTVCPTLETERLILRPFTDADFDDYLSMMDSPEVRKSLRISEEAGRAEAWFGLAAFTGQWELRGTGLWALDEKSTGNFVGRAGLHNPERHDWPGVEVGWTLHPDYWGFGYATEAGEEAVRYGFQELGQEQLFSTILTDNYRSQAVAKRLGFVLNETRNLSHYPDEPHGIWILEREEYELKFS